MKNTTWSLLTSLTLLVCVLANPSLAAPVTYTIDVDHSTVGFSIRHLVSRTQGKFNKFSGTIVFDQEKPKTSTVTAEIDVNEIDTNNKKRDDHLRNEDFFDVKKYPKMTFVSKEVTDYDKSDKTAKITGDLTLHGVTKPVTLKAQFLGETKDPWGNMRTGFTATTKINRKDFGIVWNKALDAGGVMLGEDVDITLEIEAIEKKAK